MPKVPDGYLDARRGQILDAAWACFGRKGYHATTMQDICSESELSPGAIYRYFASKEEILRAIADRSLQNDAALLSLARSHSGEPIDALDVLAAAMVASLVGPDYRSRARVEVDLRPQYWRNSALMEVFTRNLTKSTEALTELTTEAHARGQLKPDIDPDALAMLSICLYEGLRQYRLFLPEAFSPQRCIDLLRSLVATEARIEEEAGSL